MNNTILFDYIKNFCLDHNISFLTGEKYVECPITKIKSNGFFICNKSLKNPILAYSIGYDEEFSISILIHEFNHANQYIEKSKIFLDSFLNSDEILKFNQKPYSDTYNVIFDWIDKKLELDNSSLDNLINRCINVEYDCEIRTLNTIKEFNLKINPDIYTQKALSYLYFYQFIKKHRIWYKTENAPYQIEKIYKKFPKNFNTIDLFSNIDPFYENLYNKLI